MLFWRGFDVSKRRWFLFGALALAYFFWLVVADFDLDRIHFGGDQAVLVTTAERLLSGVAPHVGPPSISGPAHPGPLYFYLLAALLLIGGSVQGLAFLSALLMCGTFFTLSALIYRMTRSTLLAATGPYLISSSAYVLQYVQLLWAPAIVLPFLALALLLTYEIVESRRMGYLPVWTFTLSFLAQTHTAQVPICLALCIPVIFAAFVRARDAGIRDLLRPIMLSGLLAFVVWASPLYDLMRNDGGNLARLYQFYTTPRVAHTIQEVATTIRALIADAFPGPVAVWALLLCASIVMLIVDWALNAMENAFSEQGRFSGPLLLAAAAFILSVFRIPTQIAEYYLIHFHIIAVLVFMGGIAALTRRFSSARLTQVTGVVAGALALYGLAFRADDYRGSEWNRFPYGQIVRIGEAIANGANRCGRPAVVHTLGSLERATVPSFLYVLRQLKVPLATSDSGGPIFTIYAPAGEAPASVVDGEIVLRTRNYVLVGRRGACGPVSGRARSGAARGLSDIASRASPQNTGSAAGRDNINRSCDFS